MDRFFKNLVERAQYYEKFEFFRSEAQDIQVGSTRSEQFEKEITIVELILKQRQEKED